MKINKDAEEIFRQIGELGPYQIFLFAIISVTSFIPSMVSYGFALYASTPNHRFDFVTDNTESTLL